MPVIKVRLGQRIRHTDGHLQDGVDQFLANICEVVVYADIVGDVELVELEVSHDQWGWDQKLEPLKVEIYIESSEANRKKCEELLDSISESIDTLLWQAGVPRAVVDDFQVVLIIGGLQIGGIYRREEDDKSICIGYWCDESLRPSR